MEIKIGLKEALEKLIEKELVGLNWSNIKFEISNDGISFYGLGDVLYELYYTKKSSEVRRKPNF
jgi:hypothetical protein